MAKCFLGGGDPEQTSCRTVIFKIGKRPRQFPVHIGFALAQYVATWKKAFRHGAFRDQHGVPLKEKVIICYPPGAGFPAHARLVKKRLGGGKAFLARWQPDQHPMLRRYRQRPERAALP